MTPAEIMRTLQKKNLLLSQKNDEYITFAQKRAEAEREYNVAYAKALLAKKDRYAATLLKEIIRGDEKIADLKFTYDVAQAVEKACLESMKDIREAIGAARSILTWLREEKTNP